MNDATELKIHAEYDSGRAWPDDDAAQSILEDLRTVPEGMDISPLIRKKKSYPYLYHLSGLRANPARFLEMTGKERVLEIGGGCGTITGVLSERALCVTSIVFSEKEARVSAFRNRGRDNVTLYTGCADDVMRHLDGPFDLITMFGVCDHVPLILSENVRGRYHESDGAWERQGACEYLLGLAKGLLSPDGRIALTAPNRLGLKYFAGSPDASGSYFACLEKGRNDSGTAVFTKAEWTGMLTSAGFSAPSFYYPCPDERFPVQIFSDRRLPEAGQLGTASRNYRDERLRLFDETTVADTLIAEGLFPEFANGFLITAGGHSGDVVYEKFSNERSARFSVDTRILEHHRGAETTRTVQKIADTAEAVSHIRSITEKYDALKDLYDKTGLVPNRGTEKDGVLDLEFVEGTPYDQLVDEALKKDGPGEAVKMIDRFIGIVLDPEKQVPFRVTDEFTVMFGEVPGFGPDDGSLPVTDLDVIMQNVIRQEEGQYTLIDYEWTFFFPIPADFIRYRIVNTYLLGGGSREILESSGIWDHYGIDREKRTLFENMELRFQKYVTGDYVPLLYIWRDMTPGDIPIRQMAEERAAMDPEEADLRTELRKLRKDHERLLDLYESQQSRIADQNTKDSGRENAE